MKTYNPKIHNRQSIRLQGFDYSSKGLYFITICCANRKMLFGNISNGILELNDAGKWAFECWKNIPLHFPQTIIHEFIIMPDHIHGIIEIATTPDIHAKDIRTSVENRNNHIDGEGVKNISPFRSPSNTIGSIVRGFKIGVTKWMRENTDVQSVWQRNYHDQIIWDLESYIRISTYIRNNPKKWSEDQCIR